MSISSRHSLCSLAAARVIYFERSRDELWLLRWIRPPETLSHPLRERSAPRDSARARIKSEKIFFRPVLFETIFCGRCDAVRTLLRIQWRQILPRGVDDIAASEPAA